MPPEDKNTKASQFEKIFIGIKTPLESFLSNTTSGGLVLIASTIIAIAVASYFGEDRIAHVWHQVGVVQIGEGFTLSLTWHQWINDLFMAVFFFVVGLELKREVLVGELSSIKDALLPIIAAIGGMIVPALIYVAFNVGKPTVSGWAIPMATDIAFAVGVLVLLSWRAPRNLIIFLMALAIADDLGAVLVIALFFTKAINFVPLAYACAMLLLLVGMNRGGVRHPLPYLIAGLILWYCVYQSGVHATIAGVLLAFTIPARSSISAREFEESLQDELEALRDERLLDSSNNPLRNQKIVDISESIEQAAKFIQTPLQRFEHSLHPWVTFCIIPIFALGNAGVDVVSIKIFDIWSQPVTMGVFFGLFLGKFLGISIFSYATVKLGAASLPQGVSWTQLMGGAWMGGIGFTMSLFISQLAFEDPKLLVEAKIGILFASLLSGLIGAVWLYKSAKGPGDFQSGPNSALENV